LLVVVVLVVWIVSIPWPSSPAGAVTWCEAVLASATGVGAGAEEEGEEEEEDYEAEDDPVMWLVWRYKEEVWRTNHRCQVSQSV
jgi:hypothetical protein